MLLIDPYNTVSWHCGINLGLGYIASALEKKGREVKIIDCQTVKDYKKQILEELGEHSWVGMYVSIATIENSLNIVSWIREKSPEAKIVMGGPHATAIYEKLIPEYSDVVVLGEGELTVVELANYRPLSEIQGIAYWENGLKVNSPRPLVEDLDAFAFPAFHLFNLEKYKMLGFRRPLASLITSRGCPYQCIHCGVKLVNGNKLRLRSVENVVSEIDYLVARFKTREILICDSMFNFYPDRVKDICSRIIERQYKDLRFRAFGMRADRCDSEMFKLMKKAGFCHLRVGVESGSQEVLGKIKKGLDLDKVKGAITAARNAGIGVGAYFMIGLPFDNSQTMQETINFAKGLPLDEVCFPVATPFPGTEFYEIVRQKGKFLQDLNLQGADTRSATYEIGDLKAQDVNNMMREAYLQFYLRPKQLYRTFVMQKFLFIVTVIMLLFLIKKDKKGTRGRPAIKKFSHK